jgi:endonuclease-8
VPEGDTVHKIATWLQRVLVGQVVRALRVRPGPHGLPRPRWEAEIVGRRVLEISALGKHLVITFDGGRTLRTHLGMHGAWHRYAPDEGWRKPEWQASLVLRTDQDVLVCFHAREVVWAPSRQVLERELARRVGPDLLAETLDLDEVVARARAVLAPDAPLVDALLEQRVAGGIGNVYKSEVLYLAGVPPEAPLGRVSDGKLRELFAWARDLLSRNLGASPRRTRFTEDGRGRLWVYGRANLPCLRCGSRIRAARLGRGLRSTYWCPRCQSELEARPPD